MMKTIVTILILAAALAGCAPYGGYAHPWGCGHGYYQGHSHP